MTAAAVTVTVALLLVEPVPPASAYDTTVPSTGGITINPATTPGSPVSASPYPNEIDVSNVTGLITNLTVTLSGITTSDLQSLSAMLESPSGESLVLFAGVGSSSDATSGVDVTLDDSGSTSYQTAGTSLTSSVTMAPTDLANDVAGSGLFPGPAPAGSAAAPTGSATLGSVFNGEDPNGVWSLYVADDASDGAGTLSGWSLDITSKQSQAISFTSAAPSPTYGDGSTYTPTSTAGGSTSPVVFTIDSTSSSVCSIDSSTNVVSFTGAGSCLIDADQAGDDNYTAAPQVQQTVTVSKATQTIGFTSMAPNPTYGDNSTYTPTSTNGGSSSPVVFTIDSTSSSICSIDSSTNVVSFTGAGSCLIDADQAGDDNYTAAPQVQQTVTVSKASQTIAFSAPPSDPVVGGASYALSATGGGSGNTVSLSIDASASSVCVDNSGTVSFVGAGTCVVDANQAGNTNYNAATQAQQTFTVGRGSQIIQFTTTAPGSVAVNGPTYTPSANGGASGNQVTFAIDASSTSGACTISSGAVSFTGVGTCVIDANQIGNANYNAAATATQTVAVGQSAQAIRFTSAAPNGATVGGSGYTPAATGGASANPIIFSIDPSSTTGACTIDSGIVSFTGAGICVIDANQAGAPNYSAAPTSRQTIIVGRGAQAIVFTSTTPDVTTVGSTYTPTATGGPSGNPIVVTIDPSSTPGACVIRSGVVVFSHSGTCLIDVNQAGNANYTAAAQLQQTVAIHTLKSSTALVVSATALRVRVTGPSPTPTGTVTLVVNGSRVGRVHLIAGAATLRHAFAPGKTYTVTARYSGDAAHAKSSATRTYKAPARTPAKLPPVEIAVKLSSPHPEKAGWWTAPVTVRFICTRAGKPVTPCRHPLTLGKSGRGQVVAGKLINIDLGAPVVALGGLNVGATYLVAVPKPSCHARDTVSGITSCSISVNTQDQAAGERVLTFTATAVNGAGTAAHRSVTVTEQQPGLIGRVTSPTGIYAVRRGRTYTIEVASKTKPLYLEGTVAPGLPSGAHNFFSPVGRHHGTPLWELNLVLPTGLPKHSYWNIGVKIGTTVRVFAIPD